MKTNTDSITYNDSVNSGERFEFGKNWKSFLKTLNDERIEVAIQSLKDMLEVDSLEGKSFLDIGSGSGLFSLAAKKMGAKVHSLDFDPNSVGCTKELKNRFFKNDPNWTIEEGSALDTKYISSLGFFDIVYSWGVLHHTGNMYLALDNADLPVKNGGLLFIAIYNDQGKRSKLWTRIKKTYCSGFLGKMFILSIFLPYYLTRGLVEDLLRFRNPYKRYRDYKKQRGMQMIYDWYDWLGGLPFEVASVKQLFHFYQKKKYILQNIITGPGMNQLVFKKNMN